MNKMRLISLIGICSVMTIGSVFATFSYALEGTQNATDIKGTIIPWEVFNPKEGEDYEIFVDQVITDVNKGINSDGSIYDNLVSRLDGSYDRSYFGSMAITGGADAYDDLFQDLSEEDKAAIGNLEFIIQGKQENGSDATSSSNMSYLYFYLTPVYLGKRGESFLGMWNSKAGQPTVPINPTNEYLYPVYRYKLEKNDEGNYVSTEVVVGSALSDWYDENQSEGRKNVTQIPAFDPNTFLSAEELTANGITMGSVDNPIYTWVHGADNYVNVILNNTTDTVRFAYYAYSAGSHTATVSEGTVNGSQSYTFTATANNTYYFDITGAKNIEFNIT